MIVFTFLSKLCSLKCFPVLLLTVAHNSAHTRNTYVQIASHTCPVCSRRGRPIVRWENEMAKRSIVEVYEEVSEVHHH